MTGRSKPYSCRSCSCSVASIPRSPAIVSIGSPGIRRTKTNTSSVIPMKVGTTRLTRVSRNRNMERKRSGEAAPHKALLDVDAVESVAAERTQLEIHHFLAHWFELHRM